MTLLTDEGPPIIRHKSRAVKVVFVVPTQIERHPDQEPNQQLRPVVLARYGEIMMN